LKDNQQVLMSMNEKISEIERLLDESQLEAALLKIEEQLALGGEPTADIHFQKGRVYVKKQEWGQAINAFNQVLEIDPDYPGAQNQIDLVKSILGFFNPDLINP
jgi:tetratricopeptide (TPR) repeat protein